MRKKLFTFLLALVTSVGMSWATVITWNASKVSSMAMNVSSGSDSRTSDGITVTAVSTGEFVVFGDHGGAIEIGNGEGSGGGYLTFTSTVGNIAQIDIIHSGEGEWRNANGDWISPYYINFEGGIFRWSGTPAASVTLTGDAPRYIYDITSIEFTIEDGGGSTPATGLQVVEVTSDIYNGWNSNGNTFSVNALPGFQAVTFDEAKAWTEVPTSGTAVLVYRTNGDYARVIQFFDGDIMGDYDLETSFNQMYENITIFGNRIFYTAGGGSTPAVDPTPTPSGDGDKLAGAFSVGGDKVVYFSKANLQATTADNGSTWTWGFAENQWDYVGNNAANNAINGGGTVSANGAVDLFAWSSTANNYFGINNSINEADYSGNFNDWGAKMGSDWRTLTINEWQYLLQERNPGSSSANYTNYPRYTNAQILTDGTAPQKDIKGIILFPDDFNDGGESIDGVTWGSINPSFFSSYPTTCTTAGWATLESMGCVFLPSAGSRQNFGDEFAILNVNLMGNYWSSTLYSGEPEDPQSIAVGDGTLGIGTNPRYWGMSVRLVSETAPSGGSTPEPSETTVTWDLSDMASMGTQGGYFKAKGITLMAYGVDNGMSGDGSYGGAFFGGPFVFTTSLGKFTKIEVTNSHLYEQPAFSGDGWTLDGTNAVWEGTPAALVSLVSNFGGITQIKFTIDPNTSTPANSCGDGLTWAVNDGVLTISYDGVGTGSMDNYDDPLSMPWYGQNITSVVLPEGLISIGQNAFAFINTFSQITLPSTLQYILMNAFSGCGLASVTIPENVKGISASAFISSSSLATVTFEPTTPPRVGGNAFEYCHNDLIIYYPCESRAQYYNDMQADIAYYHDKMYNCPAPPSNLHVTELEPPASWSGKSTYLAVADHMPGFEETDAELAKTWEAPTNCNSILIYHVAEQYGDDKMYYHYFNNGNFVESEEGWYDLGTVYSNYNSGIKTFYTSSGGGSTPSGDEGKLSGAFTINANGDQIVFSKGNLQYHCTNHVWQFATNQYDIIGNGNANISDSYDGWVDLFGYGTGNNPTLVSTSYGDYSTFTDWGVNAISNGGNEANLWRTLTSTEWLYMFRLRPEAHIKYGAATVANVPGIIVLPDVYVGPAINTVRDAWDNNVISSSEWAAYEAAGAVFLPAAGYRSGTTMYNVGSYGFCWSSTPDPGDAEYSYKLCLSPISVIEPQGFGRRNEGISVRLIKAASAQDIADVVIALINAIPNPVAYNDECKDAIDAARAAYDALTDAQKDLVENYGDLLDAETAYAQSIPHPHGECGAQGDNLLWDLDPSTGVLTITGSGAMNDWAVDTNLPWYDNRSEITSVVLPSGITSIGTQAFRECTNLASINMTENYPAGLTAINQEAFFHTALTSVTIPESVVTIGRDAFFQNENITDVYCYADPNNLTWNDFWCDDFKDADHATVCHVKACALSTFVANWGGTPYRVKTSTGVNVTFVGNLPGDCGAPTPTPSGDKLSGVFSVSGTKAVNFSKGNLQYDSENQIWQFAANQWDYIGNAAGNTAITVDGIPDNSGIVDLFGWVGASSSWTTGSTKQYGISTSTTNNDYGNVYGEALKQDWGNTMGSDWRTLSKDEWNYLLTERVNAANLRTLATVNSKQGLILMPDGWTASGVSLTITTANYTDNTIGSSDWATLAGQGCVFLPAAGSRNGNWIMSAGTKGHYWSSTSRSDGASLNSFKLVFMADDVDPTDYTNRYTGLSVRLVSETAPAPTPTGEQVPTNADPENPSYHYSTFFHSTQNYKLSNDGTQAFIADLSNNELVLTEIAHGEQVIPANTAVILRKTGSADPVVLVPTDENGVSINPDDNDLRGVDEATTLVSLSINPLQCYVLSGKSHDETESGVGFYLIYGNTLKAHKAYVIFAGGSNNAPKKMRFVYGQATGIEDVQGNNVQSTKVIENGVLYIIRDGKTYNAMGQIVK